MSVYPRRTLSPNCRLAVSPKARKSKRTRIAEEWRRTSPDEGEKKGIVRVVEAAGTTLIGLKMGKNGWQCANLLRPTGASARMPIADHPGVC
jgi:hypothetical protein